MKPLGLNEIREKFLTFFETKEHLRMTSFPLVPYNDNSLLLINSGMAPLKPYFTGQEVPPNKRVTTCQKCIRTGDITNVGKTVRHGTFFEMLGNFSFGDYFKEEVIPWSWEFCTEVLELPVDKLYVSVYLDDDEAYDIWNKKIGVSKDRIFRMGKEDNFWEVGLGPCGPCSEIYFDKGEKYGCGRPDCTVGCDCDRYMEFWNLVFTQFSKEEDHSYSDLPNPNIDTGMGLERLASIMQGVDSIFDVDTIKAVRDKVCSMAKVVYNKDPEKDVSIRIITDHIRSITFMTADGVLHSNEGRGYVLKRLLRRAARHGRLLGIHGEFLEELCKVVVETSKEAYPELIEKRDYILKVTGIEEKRFYETLDQGIEILKAHISKLKADFQNIMMGAEAFRLYDTYGFPPELMKEILDEEGIAFDEASFAEEMEKQKERARSARDSSTFMGVSDTVYHLIDSKEISEFVGYDTFEYRNAKIIALISDGAIVDELKEGDECSIILDKTPFYAESGGQVGDKGVLSAYNGAVEINDCVKVVGGRIAHIGKVTNGKINKSDLMDAFIDAKLRLSTSRNHSATHLLQKALRDLIGTHVEQSGSYVSPEKLRFDYTHFSCLTKDEIAYIEDVVNQKIMENLPIETKERNIDEARAMGAMALFGEKYGEKVRVVKMDDFSIELCGGAHVHNTGQIGAFKILSDTSAAAGVRRIEALTGFGTLSYYRDADERMHTISDIMKVAPDSMVKQIELYVSKAKELNKEVERLNSKMSKSIVDDLIENKEDVGGISVVSAVVKGMDTNALRVMGDQIRDKIRSGIVILIGVNEDKANMVVMITDDGVKDGANAGDIVKKAVAIIGGNGGGRPNMAMAGGKDVSKVEEALSTAKQVIIEQLKRHS